MRLAGLLGEDARVHGGAAGGKRFLERGFATPESLKCAAGAGDCAVS